jgi:hypothetical protein
VGADAVDEQEELLCELQLFLSSQQWRPCLVLTESEDAMSKQRPMTIDEIKGTVSQAADEFKAEMLDRIDGQVVEADQSEDTLQANDMRIESDLAHLLEEIAMDLNEVAHQLRCKPFVAVQDQLQKLHSKLAQAYYAGECIPLGGFQTASALIEGIRSK